jgi:sodium-dependent phosphate transporter
MYKGSANYKNFQGKNTTYWVVPTAFGVGAVCGVIWIFIVGPIVKRRIDTARAETMALEEKEAAAKADLEAEEAEEASPDGEVEKEGRVAEPLQEQAPPAETSMYRKFANSTYDQDLKAQSFVESKRAKEMWEEQEDFDPHAESLFNYIQVFTACLNSFAHGANDVSNTIAPMSAIIQLYQTGVVDKNAKVPRWLLAFGGAAIVVGLLFYGYKVMKTLGYKLTKLSASRGMSCELGSSLCVVTASFLGFPVSSTQCIVGAVTGVGLVGGVRDLNWFFLIKICCSWAVLFVCCVLLSAGIFSFCAYSPGL